MQGQLLGNSLLQYLFFISILISISLLLFIARKLIIKKIKIKHNIMTGDKREGAFLVAENKIIPVIYCIAIYFSLKILNISKEGEKVVNIAFLAAILLFGVRFILFVFASILENKINNESIDVSKKQTFKIILLIIKVFIWGIAVFILLDNLGINITTLVAGLGIGGIAIALAAQTVLGDLFSCFVIYLDRPFEIGDYINVDSFSGTIEHIGIKTTRIRSLSGEQLVFSNTDLTTSRLRNYKRMEKRRVNFKINIVYETKINLIEKVPEIIASIIQSINDVTFERAHFSNLSDFGLVFEVVYYVETNDYIRYMDIQQGINIAIMKAFDERKIMFAYPTQKLFIKSSK